MKFGVADYGMNVWYGGCYDLNARLKALKSIGFDGIERLEAADAADAMNRALIFHKLGMDFSTVCGPNVGISMEWTPALGKPYVWITPGEGSRNVDFDVYCRRANAFLDALENYNIAGVLHNHLGSRIENQDELDKFMTNCPKAKLLLDVGHLFGAGGDVIGTIEKYGKRIMAVHFKDIKYKDKNKGLDLWYERLRFCELGGGDAGMEFRPMAEALLKVGFNGWAFVEHDTHTDDPVKQLKISLDIMKDIFKCK
ncbi:MAG: sugar phosphate isomerase/epimerase [Lentisphaeria bacterium]|nr:sugar phosphate isomerase/epimerase [Lentisphaeria bacterium]